MDKYLTAVKENICSVCVDSDEAGKCTLTEEEICAVEYFLPQIVDLVRRNPRRKIFDLFRNPAPHIPTQPQSANDIF